VRGKCRAEIGRNRGVTSVAVHALDGGVSTAWTAPPRSVAFAAVGDGARLAVVIVMLDSGLLLLAIGVIGAFDVFYFHHHRARVTQRRQARREAWIHVARGAVYTLQFIAVPNVAFEGAWYVAFVALYAADAAIAFADVLCEPAARREVGGLPRGEYLAHVVLSVLVGALLWSLAIHTSRWATAPTALSWAPAMPAALRAVLAALGVGCFTTTLLDVAALVTQTPPPPVHVAVRLRAPLAEVWRITQDHRLHPAWDHRFTTITMLSEPITTGTCMRYDKRVAGMVVRGFGRYKLHRPMAQSTFEFWSDDRWSPIRRGVGLWRYVQALDGSVEFRTSYSYDVRWGVVGRVLDRVILRRWFQRETERSFARLRRDFFADAGSPVAGRRGRKPAALLPG
jgi:hypothetical protein